MASQFLEKKFRALGARLQVEETPSVRFEIEVHADGQGEFFNIRKSLEYDIERVVVVDVEPRLRHLLLLAEVDQQQHRFLCGHDQRHWFVAPLPERAGVASVLGALDVLRPVAPVAARRARTEQPKVRAYLRQGGSFFIPAPTLKVSPAWVRLNEPVRGSVAHKAHIAQYCVRLKGEAVWVCAQHPDGLRDWERERVLATLPEAASWSWERRHRPARVYVKGRVRHPEHKTIVLPGWHRVVMNAEDESTATRCDKFAV